MKVLGTRTIVDGVVVASTGAPSQRPVRIIPPEPTAAELAKNFAGAMLRWAGAGWATLDQAGYQARLDTCGGCDRWDPRARGGLGKCSACGCIRLKLWLATERCPLAKWPA